MTSVYLLLTLQGYHYFATRAYSIEQDCLDAARSHQEQSPDGGHYVTAICQKIEFVK